MQVQRPVLRQEQKLKLTPQLFQAIKLMSLPLQDLRLKIQEELVQNPALEVIEDRSTVSFDEVQNRDNADYNRFEETSDSGYVSSRGEEASNQKRQFIEGALSRPESLQDHLLLQLRLQPLSPDEYRIGELLIRNLDPNGFHIEPLEALVNDNEIEIIENVKRQIQAFDPVGACTADYKESLLVQIENHAQPHPHSHKLVEKYLDLLEKGKLAQIARKMKIQERELEGALKFIKTLDPIPGRNFVVEQARFVIPDVSVKHKEGEFVLVLNDEEIPVLGINSLFKSIAKSKDKSGKKELNRFIKTNLADARWFIRSIGRRNETLLKVCRVIVEFQRSFFRRGPKYIVPLTLKDIANEIGVHEATVSRITTSKYMQTEWGIFELKYFFSNSISGPGSSGSRFSKQGVKEIIREIIEEEGDAQLTDKKIAAVLAEKGIKIARRTVSKYRKELDISSSFQR
ncbi:RNA polymerase sigma-54 factor [subsurface metagenome]